MKIQRKHRLMKRLLIPLAAFPLLQLTGCDPLGLDSTIFNSYIGSIHQVLLQTFPSADILQTLLGGNPQPFFQ